MSQTPIEGPPSETSPSLEASDIASKPWRPVTKIAFRFAFVYFLLYAVYIPIHFFPIFPIPQLFAKYNSTWRLVVSWVGRNLLHIAPNIPVVITKPNASTDTSYHYVEVLCYLVFAALATILWSFLDRKRTNYERLYNWFRLYLRVALGSVMIHYGAAKVFPYQFPPPSLSTLMERFGDFSPTHLLWAFMGASQPYSLFGGLAEMLGGALVIIPQTVTLGALICIGVAGNVLMLNLGYDITVKLLTMQLVAMAILLVAPDLKRLADFFVLDRSVEKTTSRPLFRRHWLNRTAVMLQVVLSVGLMGYYLNLHRQNSTLRQQDRQTPLYGIWSVDEFTLDNQLRPPLATDPLRWQNLIVDGRGVVAIQSFQGQISHFALDLDPKTRTLRIANSGDSGWMAEFQYETPQPDLLKLKGEIGGHPASAVLRRFDESQFLLNSRGFRWVSEFPLWR